MTASSIAEGSELNDETSPSSAVRRWPRPAPAGRVDGPSDMDVDGRGSTAAERSMRRVSRKVASSSLPG